jgi:hypothetical protein
VKVDADATAYFLCALTRGSGCCLHAELMVELRSLLVECPLGLVKLVETGTLSLAIVLALRGPLASGSVR